MNEKKLEKKEVLKNIKITLTFFKNIKGKCILYTLLRFSLSAANVIIPFLSAQIMLNLTSELWKQLIVVAFVLFLTNFIIDTCNFYVEKLSNTVFYNAMINIQTRFSEEILKLQLSEIEKHPSGVFIERLTKDTEELAILFQRLNLVITNFLANFGVLVAIYIVSKVFFVYFVVCLIIVFFIRKARNKIFFKTMKEYRELQESNVGIISELVRGLKDIKVLNADLAFNANIKERIIESNNKNSNMFRITNKYDYVEFLLTSLFELLFIIVGVLLVTRSMLVASSFLIIYSYKNRVFNLLGYFSLFMEQMKNFNLASERVYALLDEKEFKKEKFGNKKIKKIAGDFEFRNVNFSYNKKNEVLNNLSFKIKANETVSFVGRSGSGKTTVFNLLSKLYTADGGEILIDGVNINELDKETIRNNITIITQNPYIFNFSLRDNIKLINKSITDKEMMKACKKACIHDFIESLPEKYDTVVGEGGLILSGGQKQRVAIARALLKNTEIILFDEATSALDNETQENIQQAIQNMKGEFTILIIAHRLSTVINSDKIFLIDKGQAIASGSHKALLKNSPLYRKLYKKDMDIDK